MDNQQRVNSLLGVVSVQGEKDSGTVYASALEKNDLDPAHSNRSFSAFYPPHVEQASELAFELDAAANLAVKNGLSTKEAVSLALGVANDALIEQSLGVVRHAVKLFLTHNVYGKSVKIPSLLRRIRPVGNSTNQAGPPNIGGKTTSELENRLNWFREDPLMNEHHEHWHVVYPYSGYPRGAPLSKEQRQGEIFFYMHQQMLARYDVERLAAGLERVKSLSDYREPIEVGYDPGDFATYGHHAPDVLSRFPSRSAKTQLQDIPVGDPIISNGYTIETHEKLRDHYSDAVANNFLLGEDGSLIPLTGHEGTDLLGIESEPSAARQNPAYYGSHHGMGHLLISSVGNPGALDGIMASEEANLRDPVFWRWHKHIDDFNYQYQENLSSHEFSDAPPIRLSPDGELGSQAITLSVGSKPVDTIETETRDGIFTLTNGMTYSYRYLWHEEFNYIFNLENESKEDVKTTLRVFLCPMKVEEAFSRNDDWLNDRSLWIELDKISVIAQASKASEFFRRDTESSVIKRPAVLSPADVKDVDIPDGGFAPPGDHYCDCGWPYHLLLPKGKDSGMAFALLVIATDGSKDLVPSAGKCGSLSFCGTKDRYPDERPMGYPFDRPLSEPLVDLVKRKHNFALRKMIIKHRA